jgi:Recombinase
MIENPIYGGTYAYGKTAAASGYGAHGVSVKIRRKARSEWLALMPNAHEGYVSWERAETIRAMVSSNVPTSRHHGAPRSLGWPHPLPPLRAQTDASILGHEARHSALQLHPRLDGQWRAALHRLWRVAGRRRH